MKSADLKISNISKSSQCFDMELIFYIFLLLYILSCETTKVSTRTAVADVCF